MHTARHSDYVPQRADRSRFLMANGLRYHVREWGEPGAPLLFMVHGWMDVAASFQFLVDALKGEWHVVAPDWRGYGKTAWSQQKSYWIPDYLADLESLMDHFSPAEPVRLLGHSLGGNVATLYAGVRPARIRALINLEGLGLGGDAPERAGPRLAKWLDEMRNPPTLRTYDSFEEVAARLQKTNPRLSAERAGFLAKHWSESDANGRFSILGDPAHKVVNPYLYRADEIATIWKSVTAPVLWIMARESDYAKRMEAYPGYPERIALIDHVRREWVDGAGHMMHHDQPEILAALIEEFLSSVKA
ncbi:MAG: alpha/beta hydrolase [Burkholderiaceae bacterium]